MNCGGPAHEVSGRILARCLEVGLLMKNVAALFKTTTTITITTTTALV